MPSNSLKSRKGCSGCSVGLLLVVVLVACSLATVPGMMMNNAMGMLDFEPDTQAQHISGWLFGDSEGTSLTQSAPTSQQNLVSDGSKDTWTILMYVCGSDLESQGGYATYDMREMQDANIGSNVNIVMQTGGSARWQNNVIDSGYLNRCVLRDSRFEVVDRLRLESMGKASTLADFLTWGAKSYPADHYMLLFWNHGGGALYGVCNDELFYDDTLSVAEIRDGIEASKTHFDVVGFDTCLMATYEMAEGLSSYADYMVASEETISGAGWEYTSWLSWLSKNTGTTGEELGRTICDTYMKACKWYGLDDMATLSVVDLSKMGKLSTAFDRISRDLSLATTDRRSLQTLAKAAKGSEYYGDRNYNMIDLYDFVEDARALQSNGHGDAFLQALDSTVAYNVHGRNRSGAHGLSVFYPLSVTAMEFDSYMRVAPCQSYAEMAAAIAGYYNRYDWPEQTPLQEEEAEPVTQQDVVILYKQRINDDGYLRLDITEGLDNVADVEFQMSLILGEPEDHNIIYLGSDNNVVADWDRGVFTDNFNGTWMTIGGTYVCAEIVDSRDNYNLYAIPVRVNGTEMTMRASYDFKTQKYTILDVCDTMDYTTGAAGKSRPLQEGDLINFLFTDRPNGSDATDKIALGQIEWHEGITMTDEDLGDGRFGYCFRITDVFGNEQATEMAVVNYEHGNISIETLDDWMNTGKNR